jgi:hypothetical protein
MGWKRALGTGAVLVALAAGCGGDDGGGGGDADGSGSSSEASEVTLEDWVEQADEICAEAQEANDELEIETPDDIADRGDEVIEIAEETLEELEDLEAPSGDDGEAAADLIDAISGFIDLQQELVEEVGDGEDELALLEITVDNADVIEDGVEAAEEVDADDCATTFTERQETLDRVEELFSENELAEVRVGDCLTESSGDLEAVSCDDDLADYEVTTTSVTGASCPDEEEVLTQGSIRFCAEALTSPEDTDGVLEVDSCILLEEARGDTVDVTELACGDPTVTHTVTVSVRRNQVCTEGERRFDKSAAEIAESGPGEWCAAPV